MIVGLRELAPGYDAFLIDQFGVIHDGRALFPGAGEALSRLKALGKRVAVLTNSGKRAAANRRRLLAVGLDSAQFDAVITSGEVAYAAIASGDIAPRGPVHVVGKAGEDYGFDSLGLIQTGDATVAETILVLGTDVPRTPLEAYRDALRGPAQRGVPMICCNPDLQMLTPRGLLPAPGAIAALYAELGGPVTYVGKPERRVYDRALRLLGDPPPGRTLCIGDSVDHDIRGGQGAGLETALVLTGISAGRSEADAIARCAALGVAPPHILQALVW